MSTTVLDVVPPSAAELAVLKQNAAERILAALAIDPTVPASKDTILVRLNEKYPRIVKGKPHQWAGNEIDTALTAHEDLWLTNKIVLVDKEVTRNGKQARTWLLAEYATPEQITVSIIARNVRLEGMIAAREKAFAEISDLRNKIVTI